MPEGSNILAPSLDAAKNFVAALTGSLKTRMRFRFVHDTDRTRPAEEREGTLKEVWPDFCQFQSDGYAAYYFLNEIKPGKGSGFGGAATDADVTSIRVLGVDCDDGLPGTWHVEPSLIVHTSTVERDGLPVHKGQALWMVSDMPVADFKQAQRRLAASYDSDRKVCNPSRIFRWPGSIHQKDPKNPQLVTFEDRALTATGGTAAEILKDLPEVSKTYSGEAFEGDTANIPWDTPGNVERFIGTIRQLVKDSSKVSKEGVDGNPRLFDAACLGWDFKLTREKTREVLWAEFNPHCKPAWEDDRDESWLAPTSRPYKGGAQNKKPGAKAFPPETDKTASEAFSDYAGPKTETGPDGKPKPFLMTEADIFAKPDPEELVVGFLMRGENVCLYGKPKVGKTFLGLETALSIASGLPVFGRAVTKVSGPVVYLSGEGNAGMKRRIKAWRQARGIPDNVKLPFYFRGEVPQAGQAEAEITKYVDGITKQIGKPMLVVLDTMARSMPGMDDNSASAAGDYLKLSEAIRKHLDTTFLTLAHAGKDEDPRVKGIRGSGNFEAGFDMIWVVDMKKDSGAIRLECYRAKDADTSDMELFCFRLKPVHVAGMKNGKGAVLEWMSLAEYRKKETPDERTMKRQQKRDKLVELGARTEDTALGSEDFARRLAGDEPKDKEAHKLWLARLVDFRADLEEGARERVRGKKVEPLYHGLFVNRAPLGAEDIKSVKRNLKLWFHPKSKDGSDEPATGPGEDMGPDTFSTGKE